MTHFIQSLILAGGKKAQIAIFILGIVLFVIAAGAPDAGGTIGMSISKWGF